MGWGCFGAIAASYEVFRFRRRVSSVASRSARSVGVRGLAVREGLLALTAGLGLR